MENSVIWTKVLFCHGLAQISTDFSGTLCLASSREGQPVVEVMWSYCGLTLDLLWTYLRRLDARLGLISL